VPFARAAMTSNRFVRLLLDGASSVPSIGPAGGARARPSRASRAGQNRTSTKRRPALGPGRPGAARRPGLPPDETGMRRWRGDLPDLLRVRGQHLPFTDGRGDPPPPSLSPRARRAPGGRQCRHGGRRRLRHRPAARRALERRGYTPLGHRGRQFEPAWLSERDLVIAMEQSHLRWLESRAPKSAHTARVRLLLSYPTARARQGGSLDIPDPYFGDEAEFESCLDLVQTGCTALLGRAQGRACAQLRVRSRGSPSSC